MIEATMLLAMPANTPQKQDLNFALDWSNSCGGLWLGDNRTDTNKKPRLNKALRIVKNTALREQRTLAVSTSAINISDIRSWELFKKNYSFLPTLKPNSNIALRTWHRYLQIYAGAFGYLHRASMHWDQKQFMYESDVSKVLLKFKHSARKVLCEIESAINVTTTKMAFNEKVQRRGQRRNIVTIKPDVMLQRLQFQTHFKGLFNRPRSSLTGAIGDIVSPIDLKFAKQCYFTMLRGIVNTLKNHRRLKQPNRQQQQQRPRKKQKYKRLRTN